MSRRLLIAVLLLGLVGCAQLPRSSVAEVQAVTVPTPPPAQPNGAIYQQPRGFMSLFEDKRPRQVGDVLTIVLNEQVNASKSSASNVTRQGSSSLSLAELPEVLEELAKYGFDISAAADFAGSGGSRANNQFTGTITVMVREVMSNGNLMVTGEKQIAINQGTEYIRFSGVVNPRHVSGQNTVRSTEVADARIEYIGDGYIHEAQHMGWLQRIFLNISPF